MHWLALVFHHSLRCSVGLRVTGEFSLSFEGVIYLISFILAATLDVVAWVPSAALPVVEII